MDLLSAVNKVLRRSGVEAVAHNLDSSEPAVSLALDTIRSVLEQLLGYGYSFNTNTVDLAVNQDGRVPFNKSWLKIKLPEGVSFREDNGSIYAWDLKESKWWAKPISDTKVVFNIPAEKFDSLPSLFAQWVQWQAAAEFWEERNKSVNEATAFRARDAETAFLNSEPPITLQRPTPGVTRGWNWVHLSG